MTQANPHIAIVVEIDGDRIGREEAAHYIETLVENFKMSAAHEGSPLLPPGVLRLFVDSRYEEKF